MAGLPKLDPAKVRRIREEVASRRMTRKEAAYATGLSYHHICMVIRGVYWAFEDDPRACHSPESSGPSVES
jgi:hypothetical protein